MDMPPSPENPGPTSPPPIIAPPATASRPRKTRGWMITALIVIALLAFSVLINLTQFVAHGLNLNHLKAGTPRQVGPKLEEAVIEDNDSHDKIAVITVDGIISDHTDD